MAYVQGGSYMESWVEYMAALRRVRIDKTMFMLQQPNWVQSFHQWNVVYTVLSLASITTSLLLFVILLAAVPSVAHQFEGELIISVDFNMAGLLGYVIAIALALFMWMISCVIFFNHLVWFCVVKRAGCCGACGYIFWFLWYLLDIIAIIRQVITMPSVGWITLVMLLPIAYLCLASFHLATGGHHLMVAQPVVVYPGTQQGAYPGMQQGAYPGMQQGAYPGMQQGVYPGTQPGAY